MAISLNKKDMQWIREYLVKEKLGTGSYGVVYKVLKKGDKQYYVLKQISLFNMNKNQIEEVKNESKILASLNSSFIVKYYDSFIETNNLNIVMEYCDGGDLSNLINQQVKGGKNFTEEKIWKLFIQICLGLAYIHGKKILHRDLKTLNIFLTKEGGVKIGDLGVAKILNQTNFANTFVGTPYYLSPEICEEKPYNEKSDVWALGCILYEMATFKHPFNANNQGALMLKILRGKYDPIGGKEFSGELRKMVDLLLDKNHFKRPHITDVIKNSVFLNKAKNLNLMDMVINTSQDLNIVIDNMVMYKDINVGVSSSNNCNNLNHIQVEVSNRKVMVHNGEKKKSKDNFGNVIKNVKLEFNDKEKKISNHEDPSKKFIQMNLPSNFKKQLQHKKEKKEIISKQNNIVKQVISSGEKEKEKLNNNNVYNALNNINQNRERGINNNKDNNNKDKAPIKVQMRQPIYNQPQELKKDSGNNFNLNNINNININGNIISNSRDKFDKVVDKEKNKLKMKEMNQKIEEFDLKLNNNHIRNKLSPHENNKQRPLTSSQKLKKEKENKIHNSQSEEKEECILDEFNKFYNKNNFNNFINNNNNNNNKINEKLLDNPNIKNVEKTPMIIPNNKKTNSTPINNMKITNLYLQDNKKCTQFFKDVMKNDLEQVNIENIDISQFINNLEKNEKKITLSDFMKMENNIYNSNNMKENNINLYNSNIVKDIIKNEKSLDTKSNELPVYIKKEIIPINTININEMHTVPMYNKKEKNLDFNVNYENEESLVLNNNLSYYYNNDKKVQDSLYSYVKSTEITSDRNANTEDSYDENEGDECVGEYEDEDEDENCEEDDEEVEAVENVSVIREKRENSNTPFSICEIDKEIIEKNNQQEIKELEEFKERYTNKVNYYKDLCKKICKKSSGEIDFDKIFQYYKTINDVEGDELIDKIGAFIRNLIPENYFEFIQHFLNLIYYEVQLGNVDKELESKKSNY